MKEKNLKGERITIRLEKDVREKLEKMAELDDKTISHFIRSELKKIAHNSKTN